MWVVRELFLRFSSLCSGVFGSLEHVESVWVVVPPAHALGPWRSYVPGHQNKAR